MRNFLSLTAFLCLLSITGFGHTSLIEGKQNKTQTLKLEKVNGNIYLLKGGPRSGGNIGLSYGEDGLMTIDTKFAPLVPEIKAELKKLGTDTPKFVFNTHYHGDHTGGNAIFGVDSIIIAHKNVRERLLSKIDRSGNPQEPAPKEALPTITFGKSLTVYMNGEEVNAYHFPNGHTDGDTAIIFTGSNVVHLGDTFFPGRFPFVDLASGGNVEGLINNIGKMIQMIPVDAKIIPGHGDLSSIDDLKNYHNMLIETTLIVRKRMKAGKSLAEIKKAGLPETFKEAGSDFIDQDNWLETIYTSYQMKMNNDK